MHVTGADEARREIFLEHPYYFFLNLVGEASAGAEVGDLQLGQLVAAGIGLEPVELAVQLVACVAELCLRMTMAVAYFADDRKQRHFKQDHVQPGPAQAQVQLIVLDPQLQVAQVEAKQPEKAQEVRLHEADLFKEAQLAITQAQFAQLLDLFADLRQIRAQVFTIAAAELPFNVDVGVVVQHGLHHGQLVEVGVEQVLHDAIGKCTLAHRGLQRGRTPSPPVMTHRLAHCASLCRHEGRPGQG
ncbi:hypothetical protein D3C79_718720 [compost metagenome]